MTAFGRGCAPAWICAVGLAVVAAPTRAAELPGAVLEIEHTAAGVSCGSEEDIAAELAARLRPERPVRERLAIRVLLDAAGDAFTAHIAVHGDRDGERTLRAAGPGCGALRDALIVALLLVLDENPAADPPPAAAPAPPPLAPIAPPSVASERPSLWVVPGISATHGLPLGVSLGLHADVVARSGEAELGLGLWWSPERRAELSPGEVRVALYGGRLRGCYAPFVRAGTLRFGGCGLVLGARLAGSGRGYTADGATARPWWLAGAGPALRWFPTERFALGVSGALVFSLNRESFSIDRLGVAYETDAVVGWLGVDVGVRIW